MGLYLNTHILPHGVIPEHNKAQNSHITPWGSMLVFRNYPWGYNRGFTVFLIIKNFYLYLKVYSTRKKSTTYTFVLLYFLQ
jgi:hypothetical protein